jgi:hypothetical protein
MMNPKSLPLPLFTLLAVPLFFPGTKAQAGEPSTCFDLGKPNVILIKPAPGQFATPDKETLPDHGKDPATGFTWARVSGVVKKPIAALLNRLLDPMVTRDRSNTKVEVNEVKVPGAYRKNEVRVRIKPVFFLTLEWVEEWLYTVKNDASGAPEEIVISYQKTSGTSHIRRLCGNILVKKISEQESGVYLTEEIEADRRTPGELHRGLLGTLRTLRE